MIVDNNKVIHKYILRCSCFMGVLMIIQILYELYFLYFLATTHGDYHINKINN